MQLRTAQSPRWRAETEDTKQEQAPHSQFPVEAKIVPRPFIFPADVFENYCHDTQTNELSEEEEKNNLG